MSKLTTRIGGVLLMAALLGSSSCIVCVTPPPAPCSIETLLIDERDVPKEWQFNMTGEPPTRFGVEFQTIYYVSEYGGGTQDVYREWSASDARREYYKLVGTYFSDSGKLTEWMTPPGLAYESSVADEARVGCASEAVTAFSRCQFIGLYGPYVVRFAAHMSEVMTDSDFESVLLTIDQRMSECLMP